MTYLALRGRGDLPRSAVRRIGARCDRFEAAWAAGGQPRAEDFRDGVPPAGRPAALRELLALELWLRRAGG
jgi:serine/threonine-protein kinase